MSAHILDWRIEHGVYVADGRRGFYNIKHRLGRWWAWFHAPGRTGIPIAGDTDLESIQGAVAEYDAPRRRRRAV